MSNDALFREALAAFQSGDLERARTTAEQLAVDPSGHAAAEHLLGLIHCRTGAIDQGIAHLRRAHEIDPANLGFRVMLVRALVDSGAAEEAFDLAVRPEDDNVMLWHARAEAADAAGEGEAAAEAWSRVATLQPSDWRAWNNLGNVFAALNRWAEAGEALSKASILNPSDLKIRRNAGSALAQADRIAEALEHFNAIAAADPKDCANRVLLARALAKLQRHNEAVAQFEEARRFGSQNVEIELGLGRCLVALMRFDEAEEALRRALALDPTNHAVVHQLALVLERTNQLTALSELLNETSAVGLDKDRLSYVWAKVAHREGRLREARELLFQSDPEDDPIGWHRLRAKIADEEGNAAEAFEASTAMNRIARDNAAAATDFEAWQRKAIAYRQDLHLLARTITKEWAGQVPLLTESSPKRIAFLVGFPRSGTTLLDTFLMGHEQITVLEEEQLVGAASEAVGDIKYLSSAPIQAVEKARGIYLNELAKRVADDFGGLVVDKFPLDMAMAPLIQAMFPGTPIIFAQRHPCDVVLSGFMQSFGMVNFADIGDAADYYDAMMGVWTNSREAMQLNVHTVVYEDLVSDPKSALKPVLEFLGLEWNERLLDHQATARSRGAIITPSYDQVVKPLSKGPSGRWQRYRKQLEPVLPVLLPWAERLGYRDGV